MGSAIVGATSVNVGLITVEPGPTADVRELIKVEGAQTYESGGRFLLTTVSLREASFTRAVWGWASGDVSVVPRSVFYPRGTTAEEVQEENASQMNESQFKATVAALRTLGFQLEPRGALVVRTIKGSPAEGALQAGDAIVGVDGTETPMLDDAVELISDRSPEQVVRLRVLRNDEIQEVELQTADSEEGRAVIGVHLRQNYLLPVNVSIEAGDIGGPSAGVTFALTIVDLLEPDDLTGGRVIADTGTIEEDGEVGRVGGIPQKVAAAIEAGAEVFLAPASQADEARAAAGGKLQVIGAATLKEAVEALRNLR